MITNREYAFILSWANAVIALIKEKGRHLSLDEQPIAGQAGVNRVDSVMIFEVDEIPEIPIELEQLAKLHLNPKDALGITLDHCILIKKGHISDNLLRHELRHVHQIEEFNDYDSFLREYINQVICYGYEKSPFELDAREYG